MKAYKVGTKVFFKHDVHPFYQGEAAEVLEAHYKIGKQTGAAKGRDYMRYRVRTTDRPFFYQVEQWVYDWDLTGRKAKP